MDQQQQKELIKLYHQYQNTSKDFIKANLKHYIDLKQISLDEISNRTNISTNTIKDIKKSYSKYKPNFLTAIILADTLGINITELLQEIPEVGITERKIYKSKWTKAIKKQFIKDYNNLDTTSLCNIYNITPRTAQEYNRIFNQELNV